MTKTQDSSFAATVLNAINAIGLYQTGSLKATLKEVGVPEGYPESLAPLYDVVLHFTPGVTSGIHLATALDRALTTHDLAHTIHIDWDMDVIVYTHRWENYSVSNWTDDPSGDHHPILVKFAGVTRKHYSTVLTTLLDEVSSTLVGVA